MAKWKKTLKNDVYVVVKFMNFIVHSQAARSHIEPITYRIDIQASLKDQMPTNASHKTKARPHNLESLNLWLQYHGLQQ